MFGASTEKKDDKPASGLFGASTEKKDDKPAGGLFGASAEKKDDKAASGCSSGSTTDKKDDKKEDCSAKDNEPNLKPTKITPKAVSIENKTLDDLVTKWSKQLTSTVKIFDSYTTTVRQWDQQLVQSGDEIVRLNLDVVEAEALQGKIDQQLMFVESQQDELEALLSNYEQQADVLLNNVEMSNGGQNNLEEEINSNVNLTDKLREKAYHNAELLDERLDNTGENLATLISEINSVSDVFNKNLINEVSGGEDEEKKNSKQAENPIEEIVKLLNLHLDNLKYIETTEDALKEKLTRLSR